MKQYLPFLDWIKDYKKDWLKGDLNAGLTVGIMLIPQGMAYAMIAGLPPVYGLYASLIPQVVYTIFGTSRQLAVGPVAMDSLLVGAGLVSFAATGSDSYIILAITISLLMGVFQLLFGLLKMGFLVNFLSKPVISGFTSAAALIIGLSQLKHLIGVNLGKTNQIQLLIKSFIEHISEVNYATLAIGVAAIVVIKLLKKKFPKVPAALVVVALGTIVVYVFQLNTLGVNIVAEIPQGFPSFSLPSFDFQTIKDLTPMALTIAVIAFMEAISVAKSIEEKHNYYKVNPSQELVALGMSNIIGSFFQAYPTTGGFSRTAVSNQAGAKTGLYNIFAAAVVALTLLFLTPLFYYLPKAVLSAIIMVAVFGLIDFKLPKVLWKHHREEFFLLLVTFITTLTFSIVVGIVVGIVFSLLLFIYRAIKPHFTELKKLKNEEVYRNINRYKNFEEGNPNTLIFRFDSQIFFANKELFKTEVEKLIADKNYNKLVLDMKGVNYIDSSGMLMILELFRKLKQENIPYIMANVIGPVRDTINKEYVLESGIGINYTNTVEQAVQKLNN